LALPAAAFRDVVARHPPVGPAFHRLMAERLGQNAVGTLDALSGKSIEGYRIVRCIGQGGMGVVYEGEELASGGRVALKMMSHRLAYNSKASDRFRREVQIGQTLNHPNVLRVYAWFMAFNTQFMAMEYCDGATLHHLLRRRVPLDNDPIVGLVGQLAAGLEHVHQAGMVHRDLKPANVMLDRSGIVKLTDFGLARVCAADTDLTGEGEVLGTLRYMAPEQLLADVVDRRADLYSLGCLVYELITGRPLFRSSDPLKLMTERCRWRLPLAEDLRPDLDPRLYHVLRTTLHDVADNRTLDLAEAAAWAQPVVLDAAPP
jgi:serine/threonine protein kinase